METPSGPASQGGRWRKTLAKFDLTVVYTPGKDNTVADCLSRCTYLASKGMTDVSAHGDEPQTAEAKKLIDMERMTEEDGVKCFVVMAADPCVGGRVSRAVPVLPQEGAESYKYVFPDLCLWDDLTDDYVESEAFESKYRALTDPTTGRRGQRGLTRKMASSTRTVGC